MSNVKLSVDVPQELAERFGNSKLSLLAQTAPVRVALAIHLFLAGEVSLGKAAELAGLEPIELHRLLADLDLPAIVYGRDEYAQDNDSLEALEHDKKTA